MKKKKLLYIFFFFVVIIILIALAQFISPMRLFWFGGVAMAVGIGLGWFIWKRKMLRKYSFFVFITVVAIGIVLCASIIEIVSLSIGTYLSDYMPILQTAAEKYAASHDGYYPTYGDVLKVQSAAYIIGKDNVFGDYFPIEWTKKRYHINDDKNFLIAWSAETYGFMRRWRFVLAVGGEYGFVQEREFQTLLRKQQGVK